MGMLNSSPYFIVIIDFHVMSIITVSSRFEERKISEQG